MALNRDKVSASATKLLQSGKYDKAILELKKLVEDDPKDVRTLLKLGDTYVKLGARQDAIGAYQAVSDVYAEQGFYLKAVAVYKQMLRVDATVASIHLKLAEMYQQLGLANDSMQHYQQVAVLYEQQGKTSESLDVLKKLVDLDPENLPSRIKLAELFAKEGRRDEALAEFRSAADFLRKQERFDDYVRVAERLVYFDPSATDVTLDLAKVYLRRGDAKVALGKLQLCFKTDPRNLEVLGLIAEAFQAMQQLGKTISVYKEMARIYEGNGQTVEGQGYWRKVLEIVPDDQDANQALGLVGAPAMATPTVAAAPPPPAADPEQEQLARLLTETDVYLKYGLKDKALEHIQRVFALRPDALDGWAKLRDIHQAMGNRAGLAQALERLVVLADQAGDPRADTWRREHQALAGAARPVPAPAPAPVVARAPAPAPVHDDVIALDDADGLIDPEIPDEPLVAEAGFASLPPDEDLVGGDDDLIVPDEGDVPEYAEPDDELLLVSGPSDAYPVPAKAGAVPAEIGLPPIADAAMDAFGDEALLDEANPDDIDDGATISPDDGMEAFAPDDLAAEAQQGLASLTDGLEGEGGDTYFDDGAFGASAEGELPPELDAEASGADAFASTEIMSLSPAELAGLRAMAGGPNPPSVPPSDEEPATEHRPISGVASGSLLMSSSDTAFEGGAEEGDLDGEAMNALASAAEAAGASLGDLDDFSDATMAMMTPGMVNGDISGDPSGFEDGELYSDEAVASASPPPDPLAADGFGATSEFAEFDDRPDVTARDGGEPELEPSASGEGDALLDDSALLDDDAFVDATSATPIALASDEFSLMSEAATLGEPDRALGAAGGDAAFDDVSDAAALDDGGPRVPKLGVSEQARGFENDPAGAFFPDELEEAEFFIQQDLLDEAKEILEEILDNVPESARVQHMLARIEAKENGLPEPPAPWEQKIIAEVEEELGDLADAVADALPADDMQVSVEEVLEQFKRGVREQIDESDAETHYNLGIAYREMGLGDEAISEFEIAARAPSKAADCYHLMGLTHEDRGAHDKALHAFEQALTAIGERSDAAGKKQRGVNEYQRGVCLEALAKHGEALQAFRRARELGADMRDIAERIARLTEALVGDGGENGVGHAPPPPASDAHRKKNIDYL